MGGARDWSRAAGTSDLRLPTWVQVRPPETRVCAAPRPRECRGKITRTKHTRRISLLSSCCVAIRSLECTRLVVLRQSGPGRETSCRREACRGLSRCVAGRGYPETTEYTIECYCGAQSLLWVEKK